MSEIEITKIKLDHKERAAYPIRVSYTRDGVIGLEEITINGRELPSPDLVDLMDGWLELIIAVCRLNEDEWKAIAAKDEASVVGLSIKRDDGGQAVGINLTAVGKFIDEDLGTTAAVVINSPYIAIENLSNADQFALERIESEARKYLNGKRAQLNLIPALSEVSA